MSNTTADKAKELVEKFFMKLEKGTDVPNRIKIAKQCALICVDEKIETNDAARWDDSSQWKKAHNFLVNIRKEIEKI